MRQRYLLGKYNSVLLKRAYGLNETIDNNKDGYNNIIMESTDVNRTITSGYAELLGFANDGNISSSKGFKIS